MSNDDKEVMALGGGIQLSGFSELEPAKLIVVKKMVGNFVRKHEKTQPKKLHLTLRGVHRTEKSQKYELKGVLDLDGQIKQSEIVDYNLFIALNKVLEKLR